MNKKYFDSNEQEDFKRLEHFNKHLQLTEIGTTPYAYIYDASGYTSDGRYLALELKNRNQDLYQSGDTLVLKGTSTSGKEYTADAIMIEAHKTASLYFDAVTNNHIPIYINFLNDGYVMVHNLQQLNHMPTSNEGQKTVSKGYNKIEIGARWYLNNKDAWVYHWNEQNNKYDLIQRPSDKR